MQRKTYTTTDNESDMANVQLGWEVEGILTPQQSVSAMIPVIESKGIQHSGTFWTYENKVCMDRREGTVFLLTVVDISMVVAIYSINPRTLLVI